jgi:hypothetical protein
LTLRQLKDARFFFHNGLFPSVKDVVRYFNAGVPQDAEAAAAGTLTPRFTHPRGPGTPRGLGLSDDQIDDLTAFLENALYDPAFVRFDPGSTTRMFQLSRQDVLYSVYRPDLAALGATDGRPASGLPEDNDDALSRRDAGLEFLDVSAQVGVALVGSSRSRAPVSDESRGSAERGESEQARGGGQRDVIRLTNTGASGVDTHLLIVVEGLSRHVRLTNASGETSTGAPYIRVFLPNGELAPGASLMQALTFGGPQGRAPVSYSLRLLSGQGNP